jgi:ABC-type amino acid transport substrate-binding protein
MPTKALSARRARSLARQPMVAFKVQSCHIARLCRASWVSAAALMLVVLAAPDGAAQQLTGTLKKIKDSGTAVLGYRENLFPFSYINKRGEARGYSIDLCLAVVD